MPRIALALLIVGGATIVVCRSFAENPAQRGVTPTDALQVVQSVPQPPAATGHPAFMSPHASPIAVSGGLVFVTNTPADTVDVIETGRRKIVTRVHVGINPAGIAVRPDGKEVWVANHVSDSVSVIDIDPGSPTRFQVLATVQDFDPVTKATRFDEPVGIAFASNDKAYVSLSSENKIAVVDVATRQVEKRLDITAQDPRALVVRGSRLYVLPFESHNQTQLSGGAKDKIDGQLVTFDAWNHSIANNNVLSLGHVVDIVKHPKVPDRDLYVFDTQTDTLINTVDTLGTLLYGLAVDSKGRVFIAQTDARNDANGRSGTKKHGLAELENRAFLNRITSVAFSGDSAEPPRFIDLEPLPPNHPAPGMALATPFAIQISDDDSTLVASAAGSDKLFTVDATTGAVLGRVDVGAVPEGIALESSTGGKPARAWVLNAAANTVSLVDVSDPASPKVEATIPLEDPTHPAVKRGRIAFSTAAASTTGTFSCASCHPDGHTDQLLWVLNTPIVTGGNQIMPRSTMPVRGLRDTAPFHWDGIPGDPYGGINSAHVRDSVSPNSSVDHPESSTRHLIDGGLASTMSRVGDPTVNDEGQPGRLSAAERDDMAKFLVSVPYPPAQRRAYNNVLSNEATQGFKLFHIDGDLDPSKPQANVCGDCHRMPFLVSTNTPGTGMDAPTWRGAYDRWLILPQGRLNIIDFDFYRRVADQGTPERNVWQFSWAGRRRFDPVWDMVLEGSTGFSGAFARQVTLNATSAETPLTTDLLEALERAARDGGIVLQGEGAFIEKAKVTLTALQFDPQFQGGTYVKRYGDRESFTRGELISLAGKWQFLGTFTGRLGDKVDFDHPQPALWTLGPIEQQRGRQEFPVLFGKHASMTISGRHIHAGAQVIVDGQAMAGKVDCEGETVTVELASLPPVGMHFLQIQNPGGLISNEFIFHVAEDDPARADPKRQTLGHRLRRSRWDRIVGTWVDAETNGAALKSTYVWKIKDRVLESTSQESQNESVALMGVNAESGEVFHTGADRNGTSFTGQWEFPNDGDAVLDIRFTSGAGETGSIKLRYRLVDDDTLVVTVELPQPITIRMIRSRESQ
ncbi:MAG: hypothetical protein ACKV0T_02810 [Planctomycetales bacterium]